MQQNRGIQPLQPFHCPFHGGAEIQGACMFAGACNARLMCRFCRKQHDKTHLNDYEELIDVFRGNVFHEIVNKLNEYNKRLTHNNRQQEGKTQELLDQVNNIFDTLQQDVLELLHNTRQEIANNIISKQQNTREYINAIRFTLGEIDRTQQNAAKSSEYMEEFVGALANAQTVNVNIDRDEIFQKTLDEPQKPVQLLKAGELINLKDSAKRSLEKIFHDVRESLFTKIGAEAEQGSQINMLATEQPFGRDIYRTATSYLEDYQRPFEMPRPNFSPYQAPQRSPIQDGGQRFDAGLGNIGRSPQTMLRRGPEIGAPSGTYSGRMLFNEEQTQPSYRPQPAQYKASGASFEEFYKQKSLFQQEQERRRQEDLRQEQQMQFAKDQELRMQEENLRLEEMQAQRPELFRPLNQLHPQGMVPLDLPKVQGKISPVHFFSQMKQIEKPSLPPTGQIYHGPPVQNGLQPQVGKKNKKKKGQGPIQGIQQGPPQVNQSRQNAHMAGMRSVSKNQERTSSRSHTPSKLLEIFQQAEINGETNRPKSAGGRTPPRQRQGQESTSFGHRTRTSMEEEIKMQLEKKVQTKQKSVFPNGMVIDSEKMELVTAGTDGLVQVFNALDGTSIASFSADNSEIFKILIVKNEKIGKDVLLTASTGIIKIFDCSNNFREIGRFEGHKSAIYAMDYIPSLNQVASGGDDNHLKIWNLDSRSEFHSLKIDKSQSITSIVNMGIKKGRSNTFEKLGYGLKDGKINVIRCDKHERKKLYTLEKHQVAVWNLIYLEADRNLFSADDTGSINVWQIDENQGKLILSLNRIGVTLKTLSIARDHSYILANFNDDNLAIWRMDDGKLLKLIKDESFGESIATVERGNKVLVASTNKGVVKLWSLA